MADEDDPSEGLLRETSKERSNAEEIEFLEEKLKLTTDIRESQQLSHELAIKRLEAAGEMVEAMKLAAKYAKVDEAAKSWDDIFASTLGISDSLLKNSMAFKIWEGKFEGLQESMARTFTASNIAASGISKVVEASLELTRQQEAATVQFNKDTGAMRMYGDQMLELESTMYHQGVGLEEATAAYGALQAEMGQLNNMAKSEQVELAETTAVLEHMGVSAGTTAGNMHFLTAAMGMTAHEAVVSQREMFALAQEVGMAPSKMAEDFDAARPQMAKFGAEGTEVFKKLAVNAKHAGMEIGQLLSITEKFDTFEGAAQSVGQLNAILGGPFLSSMQMVEATDPTERMRLLSGALDEAGASFDDMAYYERIALTEAMGLKDVSELALVMRDGFDATVPAMAQSQEELAALAEQSKEFNTLKEEGIQLMRMFALSFLPVVNALKSMAQWIQDLNAWMGGLGAKILTLVIVVGSLFVVALTSLWTALTVVSTTVPAVTAGMAVMGITTKAATKDAGEGAERMAKSIRTMGKAATSAAGGMLAFGAAIMMTGIGIAIAAAGMALFVFSFSFLAGGQLFAASLGILALTSAFIAFAVVMGIMIYTGVLPGVALGLLAIGAAVIMVGIGIAIAVAGLALLVYSFSLLFGALKVESLTSFVLALGGLIVAMYMLVPLIPALGTLAVGLTGFAFAMSLIDTTNITILGKFFESLSSALDKDIEKLVKMEEAIKGIVSAANAVDDTERLVAVRQIIEAVHGAAAARGGTPGGAAAAGPAGGALGRPLNVQMVMNGREMMNWSYNTVSDFLNYKD